MKSSDDVSGERKTREAETDEEEEKEDYEHEDDKKQNARREVPILACGR